MKKIAVAAAAALVVLGAAACGQGYAGGTQTDLTNEGDVNTTIFQVNGKPLTCVVIDNGFAEQKTQSMSCDWVAYHMEDTNAVQ